MANITALLGDKEADFGADFAKENLVGAIITLLKEARERDSETVELQEQNLRALVGVTKNSTTASALPEACLISPKFLFTESLSAEFIEKEGVEALVPLLGPANKEIQKQAVRIIKNLSKSESPLRLT